MPDHSEIKLSPIGATIYGFQTASREALENYGYALLAIAGADREVSDIEIDWLFTYFAELLQVPKDITRKYNAFDHQRADLAEIASKISFDTDADYRRILIYDAIKMAGADTSYASEEEMAVREAALHLGVDIFTVESLESLVLAEQSVSSLRHSIFEIDYDSEPEMIPAHDERLKHNPWVTQQLGYSFATYESMKATCEILLAIAGADKEVTEPEMEWLRELCIIAGIPQEIEEGLGDFDYLSADIKKLLESLAVDVKVNLNRILVYMAIQMSRADRRYAVEEQDAAYAASRILNVPVDIAFELDNLVELENALADMRKSIFRLGAK